MFGPVTPSFCIQFQKQTTLMFMRLIPIRKAPTIITVILILTNYLFRRFVILNLVFINAMPQFIPMTMLNNDFYQK